MQTQRYPFNTPEGTVLICNNPVHPSSHWSAAVQLQASQLCDAASTANWVRALPAEPMCIHVLCDMHTCVCDSDIKCG